MEFFRILGIGTFGDRKFVADVDHLGDARSESQKKNTLAKRAFGYCLRVYA